MQLIILGSGTIVPSVRRGSPANFLRIGKKNILVDCGPGAVRQMERAGLSYKDIDIVFFTHFHSDHINDFHPLLGALRWTPGFRRKKDLLVIGPVGFKRFFNRRIKPYTDKPNYKLIIKEIKGKMKFNGFTVDCAKTVHYVHSIAYSFCKKGKKLVISGDCDYDEALMNFSKDSDLLVLECSFPNRIKIRGHLTPNDCGKIAKRANAKRLLLTHLYPALPETRLKETRKIFKNTILASDFMKIRV